MRNKGFQQMRKGITLSESGCCLQCASREGYDCCLFLCNTLLLMPLVYYVLDWTTGTGHEICGWQQLCWSTELKFFFSTVISSLPQKTQIFRKPEPQTRRVQAQAILLSLKYVGAPISAPKEVSLPFFLPSNTYMNPG